MQLTLKIVGRSLPRPSSDREKTARDGKIEGGTLSGSYCIEGF
jgi:hypothetical protein